MIWEPEPHGTLKVSPGHNRDCLAFPSNMKIKEKSELK
jgi:hypothetical protein